MGSNANLYKAGTDLSLYRNQMNNILLEIIHHLAILKRQLGFWYNLQSVRERQLRSRQGGTEFLSSC